MPVSDLCDEYPLSPTLFYAWQKLFFEDSALPRSSRRGRVGRAGRTCTDHRRGTDKLPRVSNEVVAELMGRTYPGLKKRTWGTLTKAWVPHNIRDAIVDYVARWSQRTEIPVQRFVAWLGVAASKFSDWRDRYGLADGHNKRRSPVTGGLEGTGRREPSGDCHAGHPLEGYRRLAFMMLDADVVAVSPSSVYRVLRDAGLMKAHNSKPSLKGTGFQQPLRPHQHWHVDVSYINVAGTFFYRCILSDGCSRFLVHWEILESMTEADVETIIQRAQAERSPRRATPDHLG